MMKRLFALFALIINIGVLILYFQNIRYTNNLYFFAGTLKIPRFLLVLIIASFLGGFFLMGAINGFLSSKQSYDEELDL